MTKEQEEIIEFLKHEIETGSLICGTGSDIWYFKEMLKETLNLIQEKDIQIIESKEANRQLSLELQNCKECIKQYYERK